jgi:hypothetical protein
VKGKHPAAPWLGVALIAEKGLHPSALVGKGQRELHVRDVGRQAYQVLPGLLSYTAQGSPFWLGFDHARSHAVDEEQVIGESSLEGKLAHRYAAGGAQVERAAVLNLPPSGAEQLVDFLAC